jgi:WD40 repeat protein
VVQLWSLAAGSHLRTIGDGNYADFAKVLSWAPDGKHLALNRENDAVIYQTDNGREIRALKGHTEPCTAISWSPDGKIASGSGFARQKLRVNDGYTGKLIGAYPLSGFAPGITLLAWSPEGKILASNGGQGLGANKGVVLWTADSNSFRRLINSMHKKIYPGHGGPLLALAWSPKGFSLASGAADQTVRVWSSRGESRGKFAGPDTPINTVGWLDEGRVAALANDGKVFEWDVASATKTKDWPASRGLGAFSPNGKTLAIAGPGGVLRFWDIAREQSAGVLLTAHFKKAALHLAVAANGYYQGSPGIDKAIVHVVETAKGQETLSPEEFSNRFGWKNDPEKANALGR